MLYSLIFSLLILFFSFASGAMGSPHVFPANQGFKREEEYQRDGVLPQQLFCQTNSYKAVSLGETDIKILQEKSAQKVDELQPAKDFQDFQQELLQKQDLVLESKEFQDFVTTLHEKLPHSHPTCQNAEKTNLGGSQAHNSKRNFYIFVSFSLGEKALLNLAHEAQHYGATLVLRGFKEGSYAKTVQVLQKIILETGQGFVIDPELFTLFSVTSVPAFILAKSCLFNVFERISTPFHDRLQGHVSLNYALETFAKDGDLQDEAKALLAETTLSKHSQEKGKTK
ncbi:MAG: type-F conjugative transfer system pilin assembly protein TrbC [Alphaproteobacteria bacterium]|nr:type-F conjugative transfer system pilin assembly protein TrbC [Alphaproteobacteria bacterium]